MARDREPAAHQTGRGLRLIPARNEAHNIAACLQAVLSQGASVGEVLVYDDGSVDDTAAVVADFSIADPRVRLLSGSPLPDGWCGKTFACDQLAARASREWILFLDADARLQTGAIERLLFEARAAGHAAVCVAGARHADSHGTGADAAAQRRDVHALPGPAVSSARGSVARARARRVHPGIA
ncbi:MAG: glycosyltransferase family 2 protein [Acidobacteria bacterium]|nr:glycosyltransferase family 2 protein [Acidobacteriota bacterium]